MNNYQAAAAQGFGPPASPHAVGRGGFPAAGSPGPALDMYSGAEGYVQATSPQPSGFPAIAVSRAPLNYSPVSVHCRPVSTMALITNVCTKFILICCIKIVNWKYIVFVNRCRTQKDIG